jgi:hypothetical protein
MFGQTPGPTLSISNYQFVSEQRFSQSESYVTYRAELQNTGTARTAVTASASSSTPAVQVVPGQGTIHFSPVPANGRVLSSDTFTILVDRTIPFDFAVLQWNFLGPVANAGPNQTARVGETVALNGSACTNPSGYGTLVYLWSFRSRPPGTTAVLSNAYSVNPSFVVDVPGNYIIALTVSNGAGSDTALVTVSTSNSPPVANAGPNQTVHPGATVALNGSKSTDADGDPLTYAWTLITRPAGSVAALTGSNTVAPIFVADKAGTYVAQLIVNDGRSPSAPSTVTITTQNTPPVANPGSNAVATVNSLVQLNGSGSTDVDGDSLTYKWSINSAPTGSTAALSNTTIVNPTFTPDRTGTYVIQLIVNDGKVDSAPATVSITTNPVTAPTAIAGQNQTVAHRATVTLHGSGTDPQSLPLTFAWSLTTKPAGSTASLSSATVANPSFVADLPGAYIAQLIVSNGVLSSPPATVTITTTNTPPVANAGFNQGVAVSALVTLNGSGSSDADLDPLTCSWSMISKPVGSTAALSGPLTNAPTFIADLAGTYVIQLIVNDGYVNSEPATVTISAGSRTITLTPNPLNVPTNGSATMTITLGTAAGIGGQVVNLASSDTSVATVPLNASLAQGQSAVNVQVSGGAAPGTATILATSPSYSPGTTIANVAAPNLSISITLETYTVGLSRSVNGTVTLTTPAPPTGLGIIFSSNPSGIVSLPASVNIAAGATSAPFSVTGVAAGSTTISASVPGYTSGSVGVTVSMLGAIVLPTSLAIGLNQPVSYPVSIATGAPTGGVTVTLASSDTQKVTISPATVFIAAGATAPNSQPQVTGVGLGTASISASAPGFVSDSKPVQVSATLSFSAPTLTMGVGATRNLTLDLSGAAPAGGIVVNLSSTSPGVATVPPTVTIAAGTTSVSVPVTGVSPGSTTISASALPNLSATTATVTVATLGTIGIPSNPTVALSQSASFPISLPEPAPAGGVTVTLTSSDSSKVSISPPTVSIAQGASTPSVQPQVTGVNIGTATINATAPGYGPAAQPVQVTASVSFPPGGLTLPGGATQNLTLTLSAPAPTGGLSVALSSANTAVATVPATASFAAGATTTSVPVTGVTSGSTVIHASSLPYIPDATANITVAAPGGISLPANTSVSLGQTAAFAVTLLAPAPSGGITVTLSSGDTSKVTISPATVSIAQGATAPSTQPQVTGVGPGSAIITASASGYAPATAQVQTTATITFVSQNVTIPGLVTQNLTLNLSAAAPSGGVVINLTSSNTAIATVPSTVTFNAGSTTVSVPVTAVAIGSAVIRASALPNVPETTANITVQSAGAIGVPANLSVNLGQSTALTVTLPGAAGAGGVTVTLASSDTAKATVTPATVTIAQGATTPATQPQVTGVGPGSANISISAPGYSPATTSVQVNATVTFPSPNLTLNAGATHSLALNLSGTAPTGGVTINLTSSNTAVATVPATIQFAAGATTVNIPVTAVAPGGAVIHASALPNIPDAVANVTVQSGLLVPATVSVPLGQQAPFSITLSIPAPPGGVFIQLASSDTNKVTISAANVLIVEGQTAPASVPKVTGISLGSANITASATGFASTSTPVDVTATLSFAQSQINLTGNVTQNVALNLSAAAPAGGLTINLSSSNTASVTVPPSVLMPAGSSTVNVAVTSLAVGSATITAVAAAPNIPNATAIVTVAGPGSFTLPSNLSIGLGNTVAFPVTLNTPAPAGGLSVSLASNNTSRLTIAPATLTFAAGATTPGVQPQVTGVDIGTANITVSATGYTSAAASVQVNATITFEQNTLTIVGTAVQHLRLLLSAAAPATGLPVTLSSSNPSVATVPSTLTFFPDGSSSGTLQIPVTGVSPGNTTIRVSNLPYVAEVAATVTVTGPGAINLPSSLTVGPGQNATFTITLGTPAPSGGVVLALTSSDVNIATIPGTITIPQGATAPSTQPQVNGINFGSANITASASGYTTASTAVRVGATMSFASSTPTISGLTTQNVVLNLSAPAPGAGLTVALNSSNTAVATVPASVAFGANATTVNVPVTGVSFGNSTITASVSVPNVPNATANVTVQSAGAIGVPASLTVSLGQTAQLAITLPSPAPSGGVTVALSSADPAKVTVPATVIVPQGATTPAAQPVVTGVGLGTTTITVSAPGYTSGSTSVQATATISFASGSITIVGTATQNLTLNLSAPAPSALTISLTSSNPAAATVPATVSFASGATTVSVPVTGVAPGSSVIHASALPNIAETTANVTVASPGSITLPSNLTVGPSQNTTFTIALGTPAPAGGLTIALSSSDSNIATLPASVTVAAGASAPSSQPLITGVNFGNATITAAAPGYTNASTVVHVGATMSFASSSPTIVGLTTHNVALNLSAPAPAGGLSITLNSSNTGVATVPAGVNFAAGASSVDVPITAVSVGTAVITASTSAANVANATASLTVQSAGAIGVPASLTVGLGHATQLAVTLPAAAPAGGVTVSLASADPAKVSVPATVSIPQGATAPTTQPSVTGTGLGTTTITASAPGYTSGTTSVQSTATVSFANQNITITGFRTQDVALNLSAPAPAGGVTLSLSSSNSGVASVPTTITIAAGASTANVTITAISVGTAVLHASALPNIPDATANVTVTSGGTIGLPAISTVPLGQSAAFTVTLPTAAPAGGVTVTLTSTDATKVAVTASVVIPAGATTPSTQPQITGVNLGGASITASASGYTSASRAIQTVATVTFNPTSLTLATMSTQSLGLILSATAPAGGVTITLTSSNPGVAGVPGTVTIPGGTTSAPVPVTGIAVGTTTIHAVGPNIPDATADITVVPASSGLLSLQSVSLGKDLEVSVQLSVSTAAPLGGLQVTLTSSDGSKLLLSGNRPQEAGTQSLVVKIPEGLTSVSGIYFQALSGSGQVTVTAEAPGYNSGTSTVSLTGSAFVIAGPNGIGVPSFQTNQGVPTALAVSAARLDATGHFAEVQALRGGTSASVTVSSSNPAQGAIVSSPLLFTGGVTSIATTFNALAVGNPIVTAVAPSGFNTPADGSNAVTANIAAAQILAPSVIVGRNLAATASVTLNGVAPAGGLVLSISSNDSSRLLFSKTATDPGSSSITVNVQGGRTSSQEFYFYGMASAGTATYTVSAPGFGVGSGTVTLTPSYVLIAGPYGFGNPILTTPGAAPAAITVYAMIYDPAYGFVPQAVAGGNTVSVSVTSTNMSAGTITTSPITIPAGGNTATTQFQPAGAGNTSIQAGVPSGFAAPAQFGSVAVTVAAPGMSLFSETSFVGQHLQVAGTVTLAQAAPPGGAPVTITSANSGQLLLAVSATDPGSPFITIIVPAGSIIGTFYLQAVGSGGTISYNATSPNYTNASGQITLTPSGVILEGNLGLSLPFVWTSVPVALQVHLAQLDPSSLSYVATQKLAGGLTLNVVLTNSEPTVATFPSSVTFTGGNDTVLAQFTPVTLPGGGHVTGSTTLGVVTPAGYSTSSTNTSLAATVF